MIHPTCENQKSTLSAKNRSTTTASLNQSDDCQAHPFHRPPRPMSSAQRRTGCGAKFGGAPTLPGSGAWALHRVGLSLLKVSEILKSLLGGFGAMLETSHSHSGA